TATYQEKLRSQMASSFRLQSYPRGALLNRVSREVQRSTWAVLRKFCKSRRTGFDQIQYSPVGMWICFKNAGDFLYVALRWRSNHLIVQSSSPLELFRCLTAPCSK